MNFSGYPDISEENACGCLSSFGRPHCQECSRASGHTCIVYRDPNCTACKLLQYQGDMSSELHPLEGITVIPNPPASRSAELTKDQATPEAPTGNAILGQGIIAYITRFAANVASGIKALFGKYKTKPETGPETEPEPEPEPSNLGTDTMEPGKIEEEPESGQCKPSSPIPIPTYGRLPLQNPRNLNLIEPDPPHDITDVDDGPEPQLFQFDEEISLDGGTQAFQSPSQLENGTG